MFNLMKISSVIFLLFTCYFLGEASNAQSQETKKPLILVAKTFDGKIFDLKEQKNKVVIVNFWAHWCSNCKKEMPILEEIYQKYRERGLEIIGINVDHKKSYEKILSATMDLSYKNSRLSDVKESSFEEPEILPVFYVIDRNGKLVETLVGKKFSYKNLEEILLKII